MEEILGKLVRLSDLYLMVNPSVVPHGIGCVVNIKLSDWEPSSFLSATVAWPSGLLQVVPTWALTKVS